MAIIRPARTRPSSPSGHPRFHVALPVQYDHRLLAVVHRREHEEVLAVGRDIKISVEWIARERVLEKRVARSCTQISLVSSTPFRTMRLASGEKRGEANCRGSLTIACAVPRMSTSTRRVVDAPLTYTSAPSIASAASADPFSCTRNAVLEHAGKPVKQLTAPGVGFRERAGRIAADANDREATRADRGTVVPIRAR